MTQLSKDLAKRCLLYLRRHLGAAPIQELAGILRQSRQTSARLYRGGTPTMEQVVALAEHYGKSFIAEIFEPVVGRMDHAATDATLHRVEELLTSLRGRAVEPPAELSGPRLSVRRRDLDALATPGHASHLAGMLRHWMQSHGCAEIGGLTDLAASMPQHRVSLAIERGEELRFFYVSPAFRLHAGNRERLIGRSIADIYDRAYGEACVANMRGVMSSGLPAVDDVEALVDAEPGVTLHLRYRRLILPFTSGREKFAVCASETWAPRTAGRQDGLPARPSGEEPNPPPSSGSDAGRRAISLTRSL